MSGILDQIRHVEQFSPSTVEQFLALQLSKRLGDEASVLRYLRYVERYTIDHLLPLYHQVKDGPDPASAFHSSLTTPDS